MDQATGPLADAIERDLFSDGRTFDELGWRGLWAYVTKAPPLTAIYHDRFEGWTVDTHVAAEQLYEQRVLGWRYAAVNFEGGKDIPYPDPVRHPGIEDTSTASVTWESIELDELVSPEVRQLLKGA